MPDRMVVGNFLDRIKNSAQGIEKAAENQKQNVAQADGFIDLIDEEKGNPPHGHVDRHGSLAYFVFFGCGKGDDVHRDADKCQNPDKNKDNDGKSGPEPD